MSEAPPIGIDLGTTFSCVSVYKNGRAEIIPNRDGERLTPSIVFFNPHTGEVAVGQTAYDLIPSCLRNGIQDAKRFIGRKFDDEIVETYVNSEGTLFNLVRGEDDQVAFQVSISEKSVTKSPVEISAEVLKYLKGIASDYLNATVKEAVITVPAYFSNSQRRATKKAAELAGLKVLKLLTEPTAAAIHYVTDKEKNNSNVLVFDFGGGTLDVSLIKINNKTFEVKGVYGDTLLGGRNFDQLIFHYFHKNFLESNGYSSLTKRAVRRLFNTCVDLKKKLSFKEKYSLSLDCFFGDSDYTLTLTRKVFEELSEEIFIRCLNIVKLCLYNAGLKKTDIDDVVLVGGSTKIPKIRELLKAYFGKELRVDLNPDEAVAAGACIQAALLKGASLSLERYSITEVTPLSIGIGTKGNLMLFFIPKNSPLPITVTKNILTVENNQDKMLFEIFEGERKNISYNNKLGKFKIEGLPLDRAGNVSVTILFNLDEDGILNITAFEKSTKQSSSLTITMGEFRLSEKKILHSIEEAIKHKKEDDIFEIFTLRRCNLETRCKHLLYNINKIPDTHQNIVTSTCNKFLHFSKSLDFREIVKLEDAFSSTIQPIEDLFNKI